MKTFSEILEEVGNEQINICHNDQHQQVSRLEAAARKLYLMAHGGVEETIDTEGQIVRIFHKGDPRLCKMIREYTEGKPAQEVVETGPKGRKPGSFNSSVSRRLNDRIGPKRPRVKK